MMTIVQLTVGAALLVMGRRLYWLLAAGAGFILGLIVAPVLTPDGASGATLAISLALATAGAVLAVVLQRSLIGIVGFVAGGGGTYILLDALQPGLLQNSLLFSGVLVLVGAIIGAILLSKVFNLGLVILSSILGAHLVVSGLGQLLALSSTAASIGLLVLIVIGILLQLGALRNL